MLLQSGNAAKPRIQYLARQARVVSLHRSPRSCKLHPRSGGKKEVRPDMEYVKDFMLSCVMIFAAQRVPACSALPLRFAAASERQLC